MVAKARMTALLSFAMIVSLMTATPASALPGSIGGVITDDPSGTPLVGAAVEVYDATDALADSTTSDAGGAYQINDLDPGTYRVLFAASGYVDEWHADAPDIASATGVEVTDSVLTTVDASLVATGSISGTITNGWTGDPGDPIPDVTVELYDASGSLLTDHVTLSDGIYLFDNLAPASYRLSFAALHFHDEWHYNANDFASATDVIVVPGDNAEVDTVLTPSATIEGTVTEQSIGTPLPDVTVTLWDTSGPIFATTTTAADGTFVIRGIYGSDYLLQFELATHIDEWHSDAYDMVSASSIAVNGDEILTINAELEPPGTVSGTVTEDGAGPPLADVTVELYDSSDEVAASTTTALDGSYEIGDVRANSYRIGFSSATHVDEYYENATRLDWATYFDVSAAAPATVDAALAVAGSIAGQVTEDGTGTPIADAVVNVHDENDDEVISVVSGADGSYAVNGLAPGTYRVEFTSSSHANEWHLDATTFYSATDVIVNAGLVTPLDAALAVGGSLAGTVTEQGTGTPIPSVDVYVYDANGDNVDGQGTGSDGRYLFPNLTAGDHTIRFQAPNGFVSEWYLDATDYSSATSVTIVEGVLTSIDAELALSGSISGTITEDGTGTPISDVQIAVYDLTNDFVTDAISATDGTYEVNEIAPGTYRVSFVSGSHANEWHLDAPDFDSATDVAVVSGSAATVDAELGLPGSIGGTITEDGTGTPIEDVNVQVYDDNYNWAGNANTATDGTYEVTGLNTGTYRIELSSSTHLNEWHLNAPDFWSATDVSVTTGATATVDAELGLPGSIGGTISEEDTGTPIEDVNVQVYDENYNWAGNANTAADGTYDVSGLSPGSYRIEFTTSTHIGEWHLDAPDFDNATDVAVASGTTTTVDASLSAGGTLSGTVSEEGTGIPVQDVSVEVYVDAGGWYEAKGNTTTSSDGSYSIGGLEERSDYRLSFQVSTHADEWYLDADDFWSATDVAVTTGATTTVDAELAQAASIHGTVTEEATGNPVPNAEVQIYDTSYNWISNAYTSDLGTYQADGLDAGTYRVEFRADAQANEWYSDAGDFYSATDVVVAAGDIATVDAALGLPGSISGTITEVGTGTPIADVGVEVYDSNYNWAGYAATAADGTYSVDNLNPGSHRIQLVSDTHVSKWHLDADDYDTATDVPVASGSSTTLNAELEAGGSINGTVTEQGTGTPIPDVRVELFDTNHDWRGETTTAADGTYQFDGLDPDPYRISFSANTHIDEWHLDADDYYDATDVAVTSGTATTVDAVLFTGGTLAGVVTEDGTGDPLAGVSVDVRFHSNGNQAGWTETAADGSYSVGGLPTDTYYVRYRIDTHVEEYYNDVTYWGDRDTFMVTDGETTTIDVGLAPLGSITGTVTEEGTGTPIENVNVGVYIDEWSSWWETSTAADGTFTIDRVVPGDYRIRFRPDNHVEEWHLDADNYDSATDVTVVSGAATTVDAALAVGGAVAGVITDENIGTPIPDVRVFVYDGSEPSDIVRDRWTGTDGSYSVEGLKAGSYWVRFVSDTHNDEWHVDAYNFLDATEISVVDEATTTVDGALVAGSVVSGVITDEASGDPIANVNVGLVRDEINFHNSQSAADGTYTITGVEPGDYLVYFNSDSHVDEWYLNASTTSSATEISVGLSASETIDAELALPGSISGTIVDDVTGLPLQGVNVYARILNYYGNTAGNGGYTDSSGNYTITNVPAGSYAIEARRTNTHLGEWYDDQSAAWQSDHVTVSAGTNTPGIDFALAEGGTIAGRVTEDGAPTVGIPNVNVIVYGRDGHQQQYGGSITTDSGGYYTIGGLDADSYRLQFTATTAADEWYDDQYDFNGATPVPVSLGETTTANIALGGPGSLSGTVTDTVTGLPIAGVVARAYFADDLGPYVADSAITDESGAYQVAGLEPGPYLVQFEHAGHVTQVYDNLPGSVWDLSYVATRIPVGSGLDSGGIDAELVRPGTLTGTVYDDTALTPIADYTVSVVKTDDTGRWYTSTDSSGVYSFPDLAPADYKVEFIGREGSESEYLPEYFDDQPFFETATVVAVAASGTAVADGYVGVGAAISGTITLPGGAPLTFGTIQAYDANGYIAAADTLPGDGSYRFDGLPTGEYRILAFAEHGDNYQPTWYGGAMHQLAAPFASATAGDVTAGIDIEMVPGGAISGRITDENGDPAPNSFVELWTTNGPVTGASTNSAGGYAFDRLPANTYFVVVPERTPWLYADSWYDGVASQETATAIALIPGDDVTGIDIQKALIGGETATTEVSGTVTGPSGQPLWGVNVSAYREAGYYEDNITTDGVGQFTLDLPPGDYYFEFTPPGLSEFVTEYYDNQFYWDYRDMVTVGTTAITDLDAEMGIEGRISGTVADAALAGISGVEVYAHPTDPGEVQSYFGLTDQNGDYEIVGIVPNTYILEFRAPEHVNEWYGDTLDRALATPLVVDPGTVFEGVDAQLATGGTITGSLGTTTSWLTVIAFDAVGTELARTHPEWGATSYSISGIPAGSHYVRLDGGFREGVPQWYGGATDEWWATPPSAGYGTPVAVTDGATTSGIDLSLAPTTTISGQLTDDHTGDPVQFAWVQLESDQLEGAHFTISADTDRWGNYTLYVGPGEYTLKFSQWDMYVAEWWGEDATGEAVPFTIAAGDNLTGYDGVLSRYAGLSGTVVDENGDPISRAVVDVFNPADLDTPVVSIETAPDGTYLIAAQLWANYSGLAPGDYKIRATDPLRSVPPVWFDAAFSGTSAATVSVPSASLVTDIDFVLGAADVEAPAVSTTAPANLSTVIAPVTVSGDASDNLGVAEVRVEIYDRSTLEWWNGTTWQTDRTFVSAVVDSPGAVSSSWSYVFDPPVTSTLPYWLTVRSFDAAGNPSGYGYLNFTATIVDAEPPTVAITDPATLATVNLPVDIIGTALDNEGVGAVWVEIYNRETFEWWNGADWQAGRTYVDGVLDTPGGTTTGWSYYFDPPAAASLPYWVTARSVDTSDNRSGYTYVNFTGTTADAEAPVVSISEPVTLTTVSVPVTIAGSASDDAGVAGVEVEIYDRQTLLWWNGADWQAGRASVSASLDAPDGATTAWSYSFDPPAVSPLPYWVTTRSVDTSANMSGYEYVNFVATTEDTEAPTVTAVEPADLSTVTAPVTISGTADDDNGVSEVLVEIFDRETGEWWSGTDWQTGRIALNATVDTPGGTSTTWSYLFDPPTVALLPYWVTLRSVDTSANRSGYEYLNFSATTADVEPPTVSVTTPANLSTVPLPISMTGTADDNEGVAAVWIEVYDRDTALWWNGTAWQVGRTYVEAVLDTPGGTSTSWSYVFNPPAAATLPYWVTLRSVDTGANRSGYLYLNFSAS